jgi:hypothetical protein
MSTSSAPRFKNDSNDSAVSLSCTPITSLSIRCSWARVTIGSPPNAHGGGALSYLLYSHVRRGRLVCGRRACQTSRRGRARTGGREVHHLDHRAAAKEQHVRALQRQPFLQRTDCTCTGTGLNKRTLDTKACMEAELLSIHVHYGMNTKRVRTMTHENPATRRHSTLGIEVTAPALSQPSYSGTSPHTPAPAWRSHSHPPSKGLARWFRSNGYT